MYHIAKDKREQKSAEKLAAAAERIILDRDPQKLTVSLLSKEADVSRTTFYRLFDDPEDVLAYAADTRFHGILQGYVELIARARQHDLSVPDPFHWYEEGVQKNESVIEAVIRSGRGSLLKEAHKKALREFAPVLFPDLEPGSEEFLFFTEMRASLFLGAMTAWVESGKRMSLDDMRQQAARQLRLFAGE